MVDDMNDFEYDCLEKKRIARSAKNHVNARRGKCKLPHEYKTAKELRAMNGEVKTYNIREPLVKSQFLALPTDLAKEYLLWLQSEFKATDGQIGEMLGLSPAGAALYRKQLGITSLGRGNQNRRNEAQIKKWESFLHPEVATEFATGTPKVATKFATEVTDKVTDKVTENVTDKAVETVTATASEPLTQTPVNKVAHVVHFKIMWQNVHSWEELYALCKQMPFPDDPACVTMEVN